MIAVPERKFDVRPNYRYFIIISIFSLAGCFSDEAVEPVEPRPSPPDGPLPAVLCSSFILNGYSDKVSYHPGEKIKLFFGSSQPVELCRLTIFSITGEAVFSTTSVLPIVAGLPGDASENGYDYPIAVEFVLPELKSGVYLVENKIPFILKTEQPVDIMVVYPSNTANAYASTGGKSLYSQQGRPTSVSFQRPIPLQPLSQYCLKWFSTLENFTIGYIADVDMDDFSNIVNAKVLVIAGHSEYWTRQARKNFDQFVSLGSDALILSGNTMWWQVRYSEDHSKMICYKDIEMDPISDPLLKTIEWTTPSLDYSVLSSIGADFPNGGYGLKVDQGWNGYKVVAPVSPLFENLGLKKGDIISLPTLEYDGAPITGYDADGYPIVNSTALGFEKIELLGYDKGYRVRETVGTFIVFKKTLESGIIVNTGSTDWCSANGIGGTSGNLVKRITLNALTKLLNNETVFSP